MNKVKQMSPIKIPLHLNLLKDLQEEKVACVENYPGKCGNKWLTISGYQQLSLTNDSKNKGIKGAENFIVEKVKETVKLYSFKLKCKFKHSGDVKTSF